MDERLSRALEHGRLKSTIQTQTQIARENYESNLLFNYEKGLFRATQENLSYWSCLVLRYNDSIVLDDRKKPIEILDLKMFLDTAFDIHHQANNEYYSELLRLKNSRNVKQAANV
jgi:hypothetical protein